MDLLQSPSSSSSSIRNSLSSTQNALSSTGKHIDKALSVLKQNKYVFAFLVILLLMYAPYAAPKINQHVEGVLKNYAAKFIYIFLLSYLLTNSVGVATVVSLVITIGALFLRKLESEHFVDSKKVIKESEIVIEKKAPATLVCKEASCDEASSVRSPSCPKQAMDQDKMSGYICNEMPKLEPVLNESDFPGYVQYQTSNDYDPNSLISDVPHEGVAASNSYTVNKLGDEHESV
jgi:hypothetical protein